MRVLEPTSERLLTVAEAAALLGVTPGRICQMLWAGQMAGQKVGVIWLIPEREVLRHRERPSKVGRPRSGELRRN
jgi:excisionase family DNA binding protein